MKILISNDDGIGAKGIQTLAKALAKMHEVTVVAPDRERSATGHALTLHKPLRLEEVLIEGVQAAYSVTGTPSDCIKIALNTLLADNRPDVVVSGINHGPNLGCDVLYSGTVSAALEGAINGVPSIATSLFNGYDKSADFSHGANFIAENLERLLALGIPPKSILNINIPPVAQSEFNGVAFTRLSTGVYKDFYDKRVDPRGYTYYWLAGELRQADNENSDNDVAAIREQKVTITPVAFDMTQHERLEAMRQAW